jgi:hypothetical protein
MFMVKTKKPRSEFERGGQIRVVFGSTGLLEKGKWHQGVIQPADKPPRTAFAVGECPGLRLVLHARERE